MKVKAAVVIPFSGRRYLMVRDVSRGWEFPGGRLEPGEGPEQAARRELLEETGLKGERWRMLETLDLEHGRVAVFACTVKGRPVPAEGEIAETGYFTALPTGLSFSRPEYFQLLRLAGRGPKGRTDYDAASGSFDRVRGTAATDDIWADAIARWGCVREGCRVLDIGCGTGRHTVSLTKKWGASVFGVDRSPGMLGKASSKSCGRWAMGDAEHLPFKDGSFDLAIMVLVLQHLDDEPMAIAEARRVLAPGGRLLIATVSHARIRRNVTRLFPGLADIDLDRFMPIPELKWHLREQGFGDVRCHHMRTQARTEPIGAVVERFRNRYISTLALVPEGDFGARLAVFESRLRARHGRTVETDVEITFVVGTRP